MQVLLHDFVDGARFYRIELSSGEVVEERSNEETFHKTSGFAAYRKIGLHNRKRVFVALYSTGTSLILRLANQTLDLRDKGITVERARSAFFVGRFTVYHRQAAMLDWRYWFLEWQEWPDNGDIFWWIAREAATWERRLGALFFFGACAQGRDITDPELQVEQKAWVRQQMQGTC